MRFSEWRDRLVSLLYPHRCVLCGEVVAYEDLVCGDCDWSLSPLELYGRNSLDGVWSPFAYRGGVRRVIWTLKRRPDRRAAAFLVEAMAGMPENWLPDAEILIPVPINPAKRAERGFNQAQLLAEELGRRLDIPVRPDALIRSDETADQRYLPAMERRVNATRSYRLGEASGIAGKAVLLVDDVFTTGATMEACAALLKEVGAVSAYGVASSYTPKGGGTPAVPDGHPK